MTVLQKASLLLLLVAAASAQPGSTGVNLGPTYQLVNYIQLQDTNFEDRQATNFSENPLLHFSRTEYFEWESYDGWFNNPAHPEWGGAGKPYSSCS